MSEGEPALASDNCNTTGDNCLGSTGEGRDGVGRGIRRLVFGRDHIFDSGSASNGDSCPTNEGHDGQATMAEVLLVGVVTWHVVVGSLA